MDEQNDSDERPRYRWPWFVLGAVILGFALAILWMSVLVRRIREERIPDSSPATTPLTVPSTNSPGAKTNSAH
jgi:hypothetical protein